MKKIIFLLIITLVSLNINAQDSIPKMELKYNGFKGIGIDSLKAFVVLKIPVKKKNELYTNVLVYLNSIYSYPEKVLNTVENEVIIINGLTKSIKDKSGLYDYVLNYRIDLKFKDGKIRIEPSITDLNEIFSSINSRKKIYVANTDSPKKVEINCIWMSNKNDNGYWLSKNDLKLNLDNWINNYISNLVVGIKKNDW